MRFQAFAGVLLLAVATSASACALVLGGGFQDKESATGGGSGTGGAGTTASTGHTTATTTTTGTGGGCAGSAKPCTTLLDCGAPMNDCVKNTCVLGCCGTTDVMASTMCASSGGKVCDGAGKCVACAVAGDCAPESTLCITNTCTANTCGTMNAASGAMCTDSGTKCDGNGKCVACLGDGDCPATGTVCSVPKCDATAHTCSDTSTAKGTACTDGSGTVCDGAGKCVSADCTDGIKDAGETDVDCGGATCGPCADTKKCLVAGDCVNKVCDPAAKTCTPATCSDGVKNGMETGVDCGGPVCDGMAKTCALGGGCLVAADCATAFCMGGATCQYKAQGSACANAGECGPAASALCVGGVCCNTSCGGTCQACTMALTGQPDGTCAVIPAGMPAAPGQCPDKGAAACSTDGLCDGAGACQLYAAGTVCASCASDAFTSSTCNGAGTCTAAIGTSCAPYQCNAGGTACLTACAADTDCTKLNYCDPNMLCQPKLQTGVACGGNDQCLSGSCAGGACMDTCSDGTLDGQETDVDCGGGTCMACPSGDKCLVDTDCTSGTCSAANNTCM